MSFIRNLRKYEKVGKLIYLYYYLPLIVDVIRIHDGRLKKLSRMTLLNQNFKKFNLPF